MRSRFVLVEIDSHFLKTLVCQRPHGRQQAVGISEQRVEICVEKIEIYIAVFRGAAALNFPLHADFHIFGNVAGAEGEMVILGGDDLVFREILGAYL